MAIADAAASTSRPSSARVVDFTRRWKVNRHRVRSFGETRRSPAMYDPCRASAANSPTSARSASASTTTALASTATDWGSTIARTRSRTGADPRQYSVHNAFLRPASSSGANLA